METMGFGVTAAVGILALGAGVVRAWRAYRRGMWAAGYWWSERDRRMGPG